MPTQTVGNGLMCHHSTGLLYTTSEGNFEPGTGVVYEIDPRRHTATLILQGLWAADGLWLDQSRHLLYVGLLFTSEVIVWDIASRSILHTIPKAIPGLLDDFCLDHSGEAIIAAAWTDNSIVMFNTTTGSPPLPPSFLAYPVTVPYLTHLSPSFCRRI
jgi:sugar lactone lactonase YvrE